MPVRDIDIERALSERDNLQSQCSTGPDLPEYVRAGISSMKSWQLYIWEPNAVDAMHDFWSRYINRKRFSDLFYLKDVPRFIEGLFQPSLHYFATEGYFLDPDAIPPEQRDYWGDDILRPSTRMMGYQMVEHAGLPIVLVALGTTFLRTGTVTFENWNRMQREISKIPIRDLMTSTYVMCNAEWRTLPIKNGMLTSHKSLEWVGVAYKMRIFLEQPFVGHQRVRHQTKPARRGFGEPDGLELVKISLREPIPLPVPKFNIPGISRLTGKPLEFEVPVRGHVRHCASGKEVLVKPHTRGPKGVRREHVIKVVR